MKTPLQTSSLLRAVTLAALCVASPTVGACASAGASGSRELPPTLSALSDLVEGCTPSSADPDVQRIVCPHDVELAARAHADGTEALYREEMNTIALREGAQLVWDQIVVPTEAQSGLVERARALLLSDDEPAVTMVGQIHVLADGTAEEVWCTSRDAAGDARCAELVGAMLSRRGAGSAVAGRAPLGPMSVLGRSLSFPTTCGVVTASPRSGTAQCDSGVSVTWSTHASMDEAVQALHATLDAAGDGADGEAFACTVVGEVAQCEKRARSVAGVTYVEGSAVAAVCFGSGALVEDGGCRALIRAK